MDSLIDGCELEWFGATTFRLKANGVTIFLDTWLERPANIKSFVSPDEVEECDYIFISHAHFDHLPGADRIAKKTGAIIYANCEAINVMRQAGVPEGQLMPVQGGERVPLFTKAQRDSAQDSGPVGGPGGLPGPPQPDPSTARCSVQIWPALHCFGPPGNHMNFPEVMDTAEEYVGQAGPYACSLDITQAQRFGLFKLIHNSPQALEHVPSDFKAFVNYLRDTERNRCSPADGGQLMYNFLLGDKTLLWMAHLGGYEGVIKDIQPKPDMVIMACAGRANFNGRPWNGSAAQFATKALQWLEEPKNVIWCLHDDAPINPKWIDVRGATAMVEAETKTRVLELEHAKPVTFWDSS